MQSNILTGNVVKNIPGKLISDYLVQGQTNKHQMIKILNEMRPKMIVQFALRVSKERDRSIMQRERVPQLDNSMKVEISHSVGSNMTVGKFLGCA